MQQRFAAHTITSIAVAIVAMAVLVSCSSTKHVPQGKMLLDKVKIKIADPHSDVETNELANYLRQNANHRVLGGLKLQLAIYNMSGVRLQATTLEALPAGIYIVNGKKVVK